MQGNQASGQEGLKFVKSVCIGERGEIHGYDANILQGIEIGRSRTGHKHSNVGIRVEEIRLDTRYGFIALFRSRNATAFKSLSHG